MKSYLFSKLFFHFQFQALDTLKQISDGSLDDIIFPGDIVETEIGLKKEESNLDLNDEEIAKFNDLHHDIRDEKLKIDSKLPPLNDRNANYNSIDKEHFDSNLVNNDGIKDAFSKVTHNDEKYIDETNNVGQNL